VIAANKGWMIGYEDNTFGPNRTLTRAEFVETMNRLLQRGPLEGVQIPSWKDVPKDNWAFGAIEEASRKHQSNRAEDGSEVLVDTK
jgi:hypothetical protein